MSEALVQTPRESTVTKQSRPARTHRQHNRQAGDRAANAGGSNNALASERQNRRAAQSREFSLLTETQKRRAPSDNDWLYVLKSGALIAKSNASQNMKQFMFPVQKLAKAELDDLQRRRHSRRDHSQLETLNDEPLCMRAMWNQLNMAALLIASCVNPAEQILFVASCQKASVGAARAAKLLGAKCIVGRYVPGSLTNPMQKTFCEPKIVICASAKQDSQVVLESKKANCGVISFCDSDHELGLIDVPIPCNTSGRLSIPLMFYFLVRQTMRLQGKLAYDSEIEDVTIDHFVYRPPQQDKEANKESAKPYARRGDNQQHQAARNETVAAPDNAEEMLDGWD